MTPTTHNTPQTKDNSQDLLRAELTDVVEQQLGIKGLQAAVTADQILRGLMARLGGQRIYIPGPSRAERHAAILADFDGSNFKEVCAKHGIGKDTLYRIISGRSSALGGC